MSNIDKKLHKVEGNKILYFNGLKWLVRETVKDNKEAKDRYADLKSKRKLQDGE